MENWLNRTELLIGSDNLNKLNHSNIVVFGCGGVGSYVVEGLVRAGVGTITIIDKDIIDITNINRQLIADTTVIGKSKVEIAKNRLLNINPNLTIKVFQEFADSSNISKFISKDTTYIIDAIDTVKSKLTIIQFATKNNIPIISSMGTGNKLDPTKFEIADINKTSMCPLAKVIRKELKILGIKHLSVLYSTEIPKRFNNTIKFSRTPASISFVPSTAGLIIASKVVNDIIK